MRRLASLSLLLAACAFEPAEEGDTVVFGDPDSTAEETPVQAECASDLGRAIFEGSQTMISKGSVPASLYSTSKNHADPDPLIDGPEIFPAFRELIASAEHHVSIQTFVWEPDTDPTNDIIAGIRELAARRAQTVPNGPPVAVRFLFDVSTIGFASNFTALPRAWKALESLALDPRHVTFDVAGFYHFGMGNLHTKALVVDGRSAIITGANPQAHHNYATPWRDAGFRLEGEVAVAMLADFDHAWMKSNPWTCGSQEPAEFNQCQGTPEKIAYTILPSTVSPSTCRPMLVTTRDADINPFSNRLDNTQDQAFLAAFAAARSHIRMKTPNLNDDAAKAALIDAIKRGVRVEISLSKGFNDLSESAPGQGGTNEENVAELHAALTAAGVTDICKKLDVRWHSRDGLRPIVGNGAYASHAKYASVDDTVVIVGTANMDTQSWNNSREVNIVVDDGQTTRAWDSQLFLPDFDGGILADQCPSIF